MTELDVSVAICTRNRRAALARCLDALLAGTAGDLRWELILVDSAGSDGTADWAAGRIAGLPLPARLLREEQPGIARARQRALREAAAPLLLFLDDDCVAAPGWLAAHQRAFADPAATASGGRIRPCLPPGVADWLQPFFLAGNGGPGGRLDYGAAALDLPCEPGGHLPFGANMGLRVAAARACGGFDTGLGWGTAQNLPGEETDLLQRLLTAGGRIRYVPEALVRHHLEPERTTPQAYLRYYAAVELLRARQERLAPTRRRNSRWTRGYRAARLKLRALLARLQGEPARALELRRRALAFSVSLQEERAARREQRG